MSGDPVTRHYLVDSGEETGSYYERGVWCRDNRVSLFRNPVRFVSVDSYRPFRRELGKETESPRYTHWNPTRELKRLGVSRSPSEEETFYSY